MLPLETIGAVTTADGKPLTLRRRGDDFLILLDGRELMSSRSRGSEEALARFGCEGLAGRKAPRVLVGGLGMGFTLRATLEALPADARVWVAEVFPAVVAWNRGPLGTLAAHPLDDPRTRVVVSDVYDLLQAAGGAFDAILLDVDNGPDAFTLEANGRLYGKRGIAMAVDALRPAGCLAVWSDLDDPAFAQRLGRSGLEVRTERVYSRRVNRGSRDVIFVGHRRPTAKQDRPPNRRAR